MSAEPIRVLELRSVMGEGGGPEKTILRGAKLADPMRLAITVCYLRAAGDRNGVIPERAAGLGLDYVEVVERGPLDLRSVSAVRQLIRARAIDVVHAHDYKTDLLALLLARTDGIVPITTAHGWTGHSWRERRLYYPADRMLMRRFPHVIAVSGQIKADLVRSGVPGSHVRVVLNGIEADEFRRDRTREQAARVEYGVAPDEIVIGSAGRLESQKRFDLLIQACAIARRTYPNLRLLIAGTGSRRGELERLGGELLPGACVILPHQRDIRPLHHALDVFVQSSDYEGTSNAVLEAMALETPIVATAAGGTAEAAAHVMHALIVPTGDARALAAAIERTLARPGETAARVAKARHRVETELSFANRMAAVDSVYEAAAALRARRPALAVADRCA
jgi:glycosyltransferase involved in cell wall biosynthesis